MFKLHIPKGQVKGAGQLADKHTPPRSIAFTNMIYTRVLVQPDYCWEGGGGVAQHNCLLNILLDQK